MAAVVDRFKNLVVYFDHNDSISGFEWDDIIANPVANLPKVISPTKVKHVTKQDGEKLPSFYTEMRFSTSEEDINTEQGSSTRGREEQVEDIIESDGGTDDNDSEDEEFHDSDYELDDGDDDLFVNNVDDNVVDQGVLQG